MAFAYSDNGLAILNLHDNSAGSVALKFGNRKVVLLPGHEMIFSKGIRRTSAIFNLFPIWHSGFRSCWLQKIKSSCLNLNFLFPAVQMPSCL